MPRLSKIGAAALGAFGWTSGSSVTASYLVVAGGGGGGGERGGGGGAGGFRTGTTSLNPTLSYAVTVGAGGAGGTGPSSGNGTVGSNGTDSVFNTITSTAGGGGGACSSTQKNGAAGGSGGGAGFSSGSSGTVGAGNTPSTSPSQGNNGGTGQDAAQAGGGGGGGASAAGTNASGSAGAAGGNGTASSISGSSVTYSGGGGGGTTGSTASGGTGGGGSGGSPSVNATAGTANTGGGGGGGKQDATGGAGGSGVVIISYVGAQQFGGGVVTTDGTNTIHTFTTSGTLSPLSSLTAQYLVVGGGGGGGTGAGIGGGGGAGGYRTGTGLVIDANSSYVITVGAGGASAVSGSSSAFLATTSAGGGRGGISGNGAAGGSGGGGSAVNNSVVYTGGAGNTPSTSPSQGNTGGSGQGVNGAYEAGGGGGGASAVGANSVAGVAGAGGAGTANSISGTSVTYAGGGGGGGTAGGAGGAGGGGAGGAASGQSGTAGTANTGGGGGGANNIGTAAAGGSGIVIIAYPGSTQQMAGGTVTISGGNVIHTFTSSGYLTPIKYASRSLRFRSSASAYISRTPATTTNRRTWTWSAWVKRGALGSVTRLFSADNGAQQTLLRFQADNTLQFQIYNSGVAAQIITTQVFRDPSAWYHIVAVMNTTDATSANRMVLYINGVQVTALSTASYPSQNYDAFVNQTILHSTSSSGTAEYWDGYMTEVNFVDGAALTPSSFGTFNSYGVWQPITYGGSYGTNGFYLPFNSGTSGYVGSFSGSGQYLTVSSTAGLNFGSGAFTVEGYICLSNVSSTKGVINGVGNNSFALRIGQSYLGNVNGLNITRSGVADLEYCSYTFIVGVVYHIAVVRSGTTIYFFVNGVQQTTQGSGGGSYSFATPSTAYIGANNDTNEKFAGTISNLRVLNGTALYTSNFTPPTSTLTAITNTSLLTLQNATFVDNSTNAFSITNNGSTTIGQSYPFSYAMFNDQSPAGNNWTANNLSLLNGTTLDSMTDVPTLTSATVANYCTYNPLDFNSDPTISNGNLQIATTGTGNPGAVKGTLGVSTGKWYWEITQTAGAARGNVGIILSSTQMTQFPGNYSTAYIYNGIAGNKYNNGTATAYGASYTVGDVIGVALDMDAGTIVFYKNNSSQGTAFTGLSGIFTPVVSDTGGGSGGFAVTLVANFGQQPFTYTPPSGFVALNTYNLSTPTIPNGAVYMAATTYAGSASTQVINSNLTSLNFAWIKDRTSARSHVLVDTVRSGSPMLTLYSDLTAAEDNSSPNYNPTSISGSSITLGGAKLGINTSGDNYVMWGWSAGSSNVTNTSGTITSTVSANTTAGFSVVIWTGGGSAGTIGHGLGVTPGMIIIKNRSGTQFWFVNHASISTTQNLYLNDTAAVQSDGIFTSRGATTFGVGTGVAGSATNYVAYVFAAVAGYSAFGSYTGNGSADGPFVFLGFRPRWVMFKRTDSTDDWIVFDTSRNTYDVMNSTLFPNGNYTETTDSNRMIDSLSNGFKVRSSPVYINASGGTYIYMAFAENPFKYSLAR